MLLKFSVMLPIEGLRCSQLLVTLLCAFGESNQEGPSHFTQALLSSASVLLMSQPSPTWSQREKAPCGGTLAYLLPASSSDSDSGCALEDYSGPVTEIPPAEVRQNLMMWKTVLNVAIVFPGNFMTGLLFLHFHHF